jgi:hypothetical protein
LELVVAINQYSYHVGTIPNTSRPCHNENTSSQ